jgi:hypothetical protein
MQCGGGDLQGALDSQAAAERRMQVLASHLEQLRIRDSIVGGHYRSAQVRAERRRSLPAQAEIRVWGSEARRS